MNYIIATNDSNNLQFDTVTNDVKGYVSKWEPIDVVNGQMIAWDELGAKYVFRTNQPVDDPQKHGKLLSSVNIGKWDFNSGEPTLEEVAQDDSSTLRGLLLSFLNTREKNQQYAEINGYSDCSITQLIDKVNEVLN